MNELLLKSYWNYKDIQKYLNCSKTKAYSIIEIVKQKYNGTIEYEKGLVKSESVLNYLGTTREQEIRLNKLAKE